MKYIDEFRDPVLAQQLVDEIHKLSSKAIRIMEVCGGHTMSIQKYGIPTLLPKNIELLSGPGCPVCVTSRSYIDKAVHYATEKGAIIATYGDLIRVPGSKLSLDQAKAQGADVRVVYSSLDALRIAKENPGKEVVFLAIGFETTTPPTAIAVKKAKQEKLTNFSILNAHKTMPHAMSALIDEGINIDAYIGPGHVSTIAGSKIYDELALKHQISIVISGFEPIDLLQSILMLCKQLEEGKPKVEIQYARAVSHMGNLKAQEIVNEVFEEADVAWRGIGMIPRSGLRLKAPYISYNIEEKIPIQIEEKPEPKACICGSILKGLSKPKDCKLFGKACTPTTPVGSCMVSTEGSCQAYFRYQQT